MASTTSLASLSASSTHFIGSKVYTTTGSHSPPSRVSFGPLRVSAVCTSTAERTAISHRIASPASFYEVLGIQMGATCQEIKAAYRRLARISHPDVATNSQKGSTVHDFIKIHEAYETLSDPEKRADYDRSLFRLGKPISSPFVASATAATMARMSASGFSGYARRRWETDQCW